jgi:hypothetical protein
MGASNVGYIDNLSVVPIGAVAEYDGSGIASDKWFDKSGNDFHGTVSGATAENKLQAAGARIYKPFNIGTASSSANGSATTYTLQGISWSVHRFLTTRTDFIVAKTLFADILLVGGGGGGGTDLSGGGHGGGVLYVANYEIPAGTYHITVGSGGAAASVGGTSTFGPSGTSYLSVGGGKAGGATGPSAVGVITITSNPNTYDFCEAYGGYSSPRPGGNSTMAGSGASGTDYGNSHGLMHNSADEERAATGGAGAYIKDYAGNLIYDGSTAYAWGAGGGGPGYSGYGGHGGNGGGGGGGEFYAYGSSVGEPGKGGWGGLNNGDDGTGANSTANGGDGGTNTGSGGGAGSHTGGGATSTRGGPGGSGICLIRYRN